MFAGVRSAIQRLATGPPRVRVGTERGSGFEVNAGVPDIDYLTELGFPDYLEEFKRLANDAQIAKVLRESTQPILNADVSVEPATEDRRDELIAEFVAANLYQEEGDTYGSEFWSQIHWMDRWRDAMRFLQNGFAVFQVLWRPQGRFTVIDKVKYLMPQSIQRFEPGTVPDSFRGITRQYTGTDGTPVTQEFISMDELIFYTWDQEGSNILGKPLLRAMWMAYQFRTRFLKLGIIDKQKSAVGIPYFLAGPDATDEDMRRGEQLLKTVRSGNYERSYFAGRAGMDFGWKEGGKDNKGLPELIDLMKGEIRDLGGQGFTSLGQDAGQGGSRGVAGTQAAFSTLLLMGIAKQLLLVERLKLIRPLVDMNFPDTPRLPEPKVAGIDPFEKTRVLGEIVAAIRDKAITNTIDTENEIRRRYDLMEIDESERKAAQVVEPSSTGQPNADKGQQPKTIPGESTDTGGEKAPAPVTQARVRLNVDDDPVVRARVNAGAIQHELERLEGLYLSTLRTIQDDMREAVVEQIRQNKIQPRRADQVKVPFQQELKDRLMAICKSTRDFGREQVVKEVNLQLHALARRAQPDPATRRGAISYSNQQAEVVAELDVSNLVQRLQAQVTAQYNEAVGSGAGPGEIARLIESYFSDLTDSQIEGMARGSTSRVFNAGRNVSIVELAPQLQPYAVRVSAPQDDPNLCQPCADLDGEQFRIGSPEYLENTPPRKCDGMMRCRCIMAVFARV